jgi:hypothetical protein
LVSKSGGRERNDWELIFEVRDGARARLAVMGKLQDYAAADLACTMQRVVLAGDAPWPAGHFEKGEELEVLESMRKKREAD